MINLEIITQDRAATNEMSFTTDEGENLVRIGNVPFADVMKIMKSVNDHIHQYQKDSVSSYSVYKGLELKKELQDCKVEIESCKAEIGKRQRQLDGAVEMCKHARADSKRRKLRIKELEEKLFSKEQLINNSSKEAVEEMAEQVKRWQSIAKHNAHLCEQVSDSLSDAEHENDKLKDLLKAADVVLKFDEEELNKRKDETYTYTYTYAGETAMHWHESWQQCTKYNKEIEDELHKAKSKIRTQTLDLKNMQGLYEELSDTKRSLEVYKQDLDSIKEREKALVVDQRQSTKEKKELRAQIESHATVIGNLAKEVQQKNEQRKEGIKICEDYENETNAKLSRYLEIVKQKTNQLNIKNEEVNRLQSKVKDLNHEYSRLAKLYNEQEPDWERYNKALNERNNALAEIENFKDILKKRDLNSMNYIELWNKGRETISELTAELEANKKKYTELWRNAQQIVDEARVQKEQAQQKYKECKDELDVESSRKRLALQQYIECGQKLEEEIKKLKEYEDKLELESSEKRLAEARLKECKDHAESLRKTSTELTQDHNRLSLENQHLKRANENLRALLTEETNKKTVRWAGGEQP